MATVAGVCPKCNIAYERDGDAGYTCACGWSESATEPIKAEAPKAATGAAEQAGS